MLDSQKGRFVIARNGRSVLVSYSEQTIERSDGLKGRLASKALKPDTIWLVEPDRQIDLASLDGETGTLYLIDSRQIEGELTLKGESLELSPR